MTTLPERLSRVIWWAKVRLAAWDKDPAFIGLDEATVARVRALADDAAQARAAYAQAQADARAAGEAYRQRATLLRKQAATAVARVRAHAASQPSPADVLAAARLEKYATSGPTPAPATPTRLASHLLQTGWVSFRFECKNDRRLRGVTYLVERRIGGTGPFEFLMNAGRRAFTDTTIPLGASEVHYRITAQTSTRRGQPAIFPVLFGCVPDAGMVDRDDDARAA